MIDNSIQKILGVNNELGYFWNSLDIIKNPFFILDIVIVAIIVYWMYLFLKETRAMRILYGIIFLLLIYFLSKTLNLVALNFLLKALTPMFLVAIPVVFQPELRSLLERLGRADIVSDFRRLKGSEITDVIDNIVNSVKVLASSKIGALIVISQKTGLKNIIETGTKVDSKISENLLLTIFHPKTPLHDGAVIIKGNKIAAAGCMLPLSDNVYQSKIGTRHRAAIGLSEQSDAIVIIVSEESGSISLASGGILNQDIDIYKLRKLLEDLIQQGRIKSKPASND